MRRHLRRTYMSAGFLFLAGCAQVATPVSVHTPKPEHEGKEPTQIGIACAHKILWVFSFGDSHIRTAKKNGKVRDIATVETLEKNLLVNAFPFNFYQRRCTEVSGY